MKPVSFPGAPITRIGYQFEDIGMFPGHLMYQRLLFFGELQLNRRLRAGRWFGAGHRISSGTGNVRANWATRTGRRTIADWFGIPGEAGLCSGRWQWVHGRVTVLLRSILIAAGAFHPQAYRGEGELHPLPTGAGISFPLVP